MKCIHIWISHIFQVPSIDDNEDLEFTHEAFRLVYRFLSQNYGVSGLTLERNLLNKIFFLMKTKMGLQT